MVEAHATSAKVTLVTAGKKLGALRAEVKEACHQWTAATHAVPGTESRRAAAEPSVEDIRAERLTARQEFAGAVTTAAGMFEKHGQPLHTAQEEVAAVRTELVAVRGSSDATVATLTSARQELGAVLVDLAVANQRAAAPYSACPPLPLTAPSPQVPHQPHRAHLVLRLD